jgi:Tol biopolymer transport system component
MKVQRLGSTWRLAGLGLAIAVAAVGAARPAAAQATTERVSVSSAGAQATGESGTIYSVWTVSADGRYVAFESGASNLVAGDSNGVYDVFVHDRATGATTRVSVDSAGVEGNISSRAPSISGNGRMVAFYSWATNLVADDTNGVPDIFVRDLWTGVTTRVSVSLNGYQSNSNSDQPAISADGRFVAFISDATNLVGNDNNNHGDVFVRDLLLQTTERVSVSTLGEEGNDGSSGPLSISATGRFVAFKSRATTLVANDTNDCLDVFVHDRLSETTERVSVGNGGAEADDESVWPSVTDDGRWVAFSSVATNLVADDSNGESDVFVRDRFLHTTRRVSVGPGGVQGDSTSVTPSISADATIVAFTSFASNLVAGDTDWHGDIFTHDLSSGTTERVSISSGGSQGNDNSSYPSISRDGAYVAFESLASNLVDGDTNLVKDVFLRGSLRVATTVFEDGFANGGTSGWTVTVP